MPEHANNTETEIRGPRDSPRLRYSQTTNIG